MVSIFCLCVCVCVCVKVKKEVNWDEEEEKLREKRKNRMAKAKHSSSSSSEDEAGDSEATLHRKRHRQRCSQKKGWRLGVTGQNFNGGDVSETIYETEYHSEYEPSHVHSEPEEVGWSTPPPRPRLFRDAHSAPRLPRQRQQQNPTSEMRHSANLDRKLPIPIANLNVPKTDDDDMAEGFVSGYNSDSEYLSGYDDYGSHRTTNMASKRLEYVDTPDDFSPSQSGAHDTPNNLSPSKYGVHDTPDNLSPGKSGAHDTPDDLSPSKSGTHDTPDNLSGAHSPPDMSPSLFSSDQVDEDIPIGSGDQGDEKRAVNGMETVPQESSEERDEMKCGFAPCACGRQVGVDGRSCDRHMTTPTVMYTNITYVTYCRCSLCCRPQWCNNGCHTLTSPPLHQCHYCHSTHTQHPQHYQTTNSVGYHPFVRTSVDPDHNGPDQTSNVSLNKRKLDINPSDQLPDGTAEPPNKKPCL